MLPLQRHLGEWEPVISGLVAADRGDTAADQGLELILASLGEHADWQQLVGVLRRIHAGERDPGLVTGLDLIDTAVVQRALDALAGVVPVDVAAWHGRTTSTAQEKLGAVATATVMAASGDPDVTNALQPLLEALAAHPDWAALADVLRRVLAGERDPALLDRLDDPAAAAVVALVLGQLTQSSSLLRAPAQPTDSPPRGAA